MSKASEMREICEKIQDSFSTLAELFGELSLYMEDDEDEDDCGEHATSTLGVVSSVPPFAQTTKAPMRTYPTAEACST